MFLGTKEYQLETNIILKMASADDDKLWPEEEQALEDIMTGKTKMVTVTAEEMIAELEAIEAEAPDLYKALAEEDESLIGCCPPIEYSDQLCISCKINKAKKSYLYCPDCYNIEFAPP